MTGIDINIPKRMTFGAALRLLKEGYKLRRKGWNGKEQYILFEPLEKDLIRLTIWRPFIGISKPTEGSAIRAITPWTASQEDMLSDDWEVVP